MAHREPTDKKSDRLLKRKIHRTKLTSNVKTLDDLFTRSDINEILERVEKVKTEATDMIIIYKTKDGYVQYESTDTNQTNMLGIIEFTKNMLLNPLEGE